MPVICTGSNSQTPFSRYYLPFLPESLQKMDDSIKGTLNVKLPEEKEYLLRNITAGLQRIDGIKAIVLGGSYATGLATDHSDLDIGIYYSDLLPFDLTAIKWLAEAFSANDKPTVTGFYEWGPWVNGGAWIKTLNGKADLLYKNIEQISATIEKAQNGIWEEHFEQQPPYGFSSIIFLAETRSCIPLYDPEGIIEQLKQAVRQYPQKLKQAVIQQSLWSAEFTIWQAAGFAFKADVYNTLGCLTRAVKNIVTALFSINEYYPIGDKNALAILEALQQRPADLTEKIDKILCPGQHKLPESVLLLKILFQETAELAQGFYKPVYKL